VLVTAVAILATLIAPLSSAQTVNATLVPSSIGNNGTFTLTLQISTNFVSSGITYFLQSSSNANGLFRIVSRDMSMSPYPDPTTDDATAFGGDAGLLNPVNDFDLGATNNGSATDPAGMYTIAILTLQLVNPFPGPASTAYLSTAASSQIALAGGLKTAHLQLWPRLSSPSRSQQPFPSLYSAGCCFSAPHGALGGKPAAGTWPRPTATDSQRVTRWGTTSGEVSLDAAHNT
jgi:hypothetical protein